MLVRLFQIPQWINNNTCYLHGSFHSKGFIAWQMLLSNLTQVTQKNQWQRWIQATLLPNISPDSLNKERNRPSCIAMLAWDKRGFFQVFIFIELRQKQVKSYPDDPSKSSKRSSYQPFRQAFPLLTAQNTRNKTKGKKVEACLSLIFLLFSSSAHLRPGHLAAKATACYVAHQQRGLSVK